MNTSTQVPQPTPPKKKSFWKAVGSLAKKNKRHFVVLVRSGIALWSVLALFFWAASLTMDKYTPEQQYVIRLGLHIFTFPSLTLAVGWGVYKATVITKSFFEALAEEMRM